MGKMRRVLTLAAAGVLAAGGTTAVAAQSSAAAPSWPGPTKAAASALNWYSVPAFSKNPPVTIRTCPANSCGVVQTIPESIWLEDLCVTASLDNTGLWDLVYRPNGKRAGFVPRSKIYAQTGWTLTDNPC